jgi:hypothetical protein
MHVPFSLVSYRIHSLLSPLSIPPSHSIIPQPQSVARRSRVFYEHCIVNGDQADGGRCHRTDVPASLTMSICHHTFCLSRLSVQYSTVSVTRSRSTSTFADRYLHVYIEPSENRSIGGEGRGDGSPRQTRGKSISLYICIPQGGMCSTNLALLFLFFPCRRFATPASVNRNSPRNLSNQCGHFFTWRRRETE